MIRIENDVKKMLSKIDNLYISDKFFEMISQGSCDCDEIVIKSGEKFILLTSHSIREDGYINFKAVNDFPEERLTFQLDFSSDAVVFDRLLLLDNKQIKNNDIIGNNDSIEIDDKIEGLRFRFGDAFLFIFALEYNLVLTKSKYDLFEKIDSELPEFEEILPIVRRK